MSRPMLLPHLAPIWRDRTSLQLGTDPAVALIVEFNEPGAARVLPLCDGVRTEPQILRAAAARGVPADRAGRVVAALRRAGLLVDAAAVWSRGLPAPARDALRGEAASLSRELAVGGAADPAAGAVADMLRRRLAARALITGAGPVVALLGAGLAAAGIGHVAVARGGSAGPGSDPAGPATPAGPAAPLGPAIPLGPATPAGPVGLDPVELIRLVAPTVRTAALRPSDASIVVHVGAGAPPPVAPGATYPQLAVAVRDGAVSVGPLVPRGGSPCLDCVERHRRDTDPAWPTLAGQLATGGACPPVGVSTLLAAAGFAAAEVLAALDGRPTRTLGASVPVTAEGPGRPRPWRRHPECSCPTVRRSRGRGAIREVRMIR